MATVSPPPILRKPRQFNEDRDVRSYLDAIERLLLQLWDRSGGGNDLIEEVQVGELYEPGIQTQDIEELFDGLLSEFDSIWSPSDDKIEIISLSPSDTSFTTTGDQVIICNNSSQATITLNSNPDDGEQVKIKRRSGRVVVSGSIDGSSSKTIQEKYDSPHLVFTLSAGEWSIV